MNHPTAGETGRETMMMNVISDAVRQYCIGCGLPAVESWAKSWLAGDRSASAASAAKNAAMQAATDPSITERRQGELVAAGCVADAAKAWAAWRDATDAANALAWAERQLARRSRVA